MNKIDIALDLSGSFIASDFEKDFKTMKEKF